MLREAATRSARQRAIADPSTQPSESQQPAGTRLGTRTCRERHFPPRSARLFLPAPTAQRLRSADDRARVLVRHRLACGDDRLRAKRGPFYLRIEGAHRADAPAICARALAFMCSILLRYVETLGNLGIRDTATTFSRSASRGGGTNREQGSLRGPHGTQPITLSSTVRSPIGNRTAPLSPTAR